MEQFGCQKDLIGEFCLKVIPQRKKLFHAQMFPTNVCFKKYNLKDRLQCLFNRYGEPNLPHLYLFWH